MATFSNIFGANKSKNEQIEYYCSFCDYSCCRKFNWERHITTLKHSQTTNNNNLATNNEQKEHKFVCDRCNKEYHDRTGLWRHKKKCNSEKCHDDGKTESSASVEITPDLIFALIKQNNEFQQTIIEQNKTIVELSKNNQTNNIFHTNNTNSNNKTFNLQVFLNETCKDAMNISDFVESIKLQVSDLENVGKVGYIEGISNIIIKNLQALEVEKRPVHCTDQKREVMYVKEDNIWEKEEEANKKLRKAIRGIAHKNICMFKEFREKYPDCEEYDSKKNSQYNKIVYEAM